VSAIELRIGRLVVDVEDPATAQRVVALLQDAMRRVGERLALEQLSSVTTRYEISLERIALAPLSLSEAAGLQAVEQLADDLYTRIERARQC
jgi:hypothetical protein